MPPVLVDRPQGTGDYLFMFFHDSAKLRVGDTTRIHPSNTLMLWARGAGHFYGNESRRWLHSWIHCDGSWVARAIERTGLSLNSSYVLNGPQLVEKYLALLYAELSARRNADTVILKNVLDSWLREVDRAVNRSPDENPLPARMVRVRNYIDAHFNEKLTLARLARAAGISVPHFCDEFKRTFGMPPGRYVTNLRLEQADLLLHDRNLSITEIAASVGYNSLYHFSRLFKKRHGVSPRARRRAMG